MITKKGITLAWILIALMVRGQQPFHIDEKGQKLKQFYLNMNVENLWISGHHINWETGEPDNPNAEHGIHTHCSAFVAAACKRLNIYILRPPDHKQLLLANAQFDWLPSQEAREKGWKPISGANRYAAAQGYADSGYLVIAACKNPDPKIPGHIAFVMPDQLSGKRIEESGPMLIMAGSHNHNFISLRAGFASHIHSWPEEEILFYYNSELPAGL